MFLTLFLQVIESWSIVSTIENTLIVWNMFSNLAVVDATTYFEVGERYTPPFFRN